MKRQFKKFRKGRNKSYFSGSYEPSFCRYGLKSLEFCRVNGKQIESGRKVISREVKKTGKLIVRIKPCIPITKKPIEVRMGSGKGELSDVVFNIKPGHFIYEVDFSDSNIAKRLLKKAGMKLPFKTAYVSVSQ
ncbi:50S ribosomal protein L16 [Candidatus Vidania fulgoroideorum]